MRGKVFSKKFLCILIVGLIILTAALTLHLSPVLNAASSPRAGDADYNYGEALQKSIMFYKANRLGDLPDDYVLPYRGDAAMTDGQDVGLDLTGGWADAGDGVKFGHPMAYAASQLGWAVYEYREGFKNSGLLDIILDEIKWATDYFIKAHPEPNVFYYDCGYGESDHSVWAPHEFLEYLTERTSFKVDTSKPGSDVAGMTAAALAIASIIFEETDPSYADKCLSHAEDLFAFADKYQGKNPLNNFYQSGSYLDDLTWGAIWLYIKTNDQTYLDKAKSYIPITSLGGQHTHCWDDVSYGAAIKIAQVTKNEQYAAMVEKNLDYWLPDGGLKYTPGGLAWLSQWGSLRYASTAAFLAFVWADDESVGTSAKKTAYREFAEKQINYALGDNPRNGSYMVGFGENAPEHPHHRTAHGSWLSMTKVPSFHRHILYGALVGGPSSDDGWEDNVEDYTLNEVSCDYNAGVVGSLAKMYAMYGGDPLKNWPKPEDFRPEADKEIVEYFTRGWIVYEGYGALNLLFQVNNRSGWPPTMKDDMSTKYFMDLSELFNAGYTEKDVKIELGVNDGCKISELKKWSDNIYYFVLDFSGTKIMPAEWELCEKDANVSIKCPQEVSYKNDWSFKNLTNPPDYDAKSFNGMTPYIPVYSSDKLLWGEEPPKSGVVSQSPATKTIRTSSPTSLTVTPSTVVTTSVPTTRVTTSPITSTPSITSTPASGQNYTVNYTAVNDWGNGSTIAITIKNTGSSTISNWQLNWTFSGNQKITNLWNGSYTQSGSVVTVKCANYNTTIAAGSSVEIGLTISYSGTNTKPTDFVLK